MNEKNCWCGGRVPRDHPEVCEESPFHNPTSTGRPEKISRLYIAGPMSGYPENNYPAFHEAAGHLRRRGFEVVSPAEFGGVEGLSSYVDLIREDLRVMLDCHGVATLENWWESHGARNEVNVAGMLKMPVRTVGEWVAKSIFRQSKIG